MSQGAEQIALSQQIAHSLVGLGTKMLPDQLGDVLAGQQAGLPGGRLRQAVDTHDSIQRHDGSALALQRDRRGSQLAPAQHGFQVGQIGPGQRVDARVVGAKPNPIHEQE